MSVNAGSYRSLDNLPPPFSDLQTLKRDVLDGPPTAALPCNLSDYWLEQIAGDFESCHGAADTDDYAARMAAPLALILHLLRGKPDYVSRPIPMDTLERLFHEYRLEVLLELISRGSDVKSSRAT